MGRRGRKRQLDVESRYWLLIAAGVGTAEACRQVGIGRKTGYRWRAEHGGLPPGRLLDVTRGNRFLSLLERQRIATLRRQGLGIREIARRLDRAPSTVSREVRRNMRPHDRAIYDADLAHARAKENARRSGRKRRLVIDHELRSLVQDKLELDWSPQQIALFLRQEFPGRKDWHLSHETINQALYRGNSGLSRTLTRRLRTRRPMRRRRRRADERQIRFRAPGRSISERPAAAQARTRIGDWEGDLIVGTSNRSAIGTMVDRTTRYVRLIHLPFGHDADRMVEGFGPVLAGIPGAARLTLTWDQGSEMARHDLVDAHFTEGIYFADVASPWLRGTNENTNGLLRQYFPKGTDLSVHTMEDLRFVEDRLNNRPRRVLGGRTPAQVFTEPIARMRESVLRPSWNPRWNSPSVRGSNFAFP